MKPESASVKLSSALLQKFVLLLVRSRKSAIENLCIIIKDVCITDANEQSHTEWVAPF